jgi:hypothetical protein
MMKSLGPRYLCALALSVALGAACAHESDVTTTTAVRVDADDPVRKIAGARCRRAAECNRIGAGQMYSDQEDCLHRASEGAWRVAGACTNGYDQARLDKCVDMLENERCDANLGDITAMDECRKYCR